MWQINSGINMVRVDMLTEEGQGKDGLTERWYDSDWRDWETKHIVSTPCSPTIHSDTKH